MFRRWQANEKMKTLSSVKQDYHNRCVADEIFVFALSATGLEEMPQDLSNASLEIALKMNM